MKWKSTAVLIVIALAAGAYIWFYEKNQLSTEERERQGTRVFRLKADEINEIAIKKGESEVVCRKDGDGIWQMEKPVRYRADKSRLASVSSRLESLKSERVIKGSEVDAKKLEEFGLSKPRLEARFKVAGREKVLQIGRDTPLGDTLYAKAKGESDVHILNKGIYTFLDKKPDELRDRGVVDFEADELSKVDVARGGKLIEVVQEEGVWRISKPLSARGDPDKISGMLRKIRNLRVRDFIADRPGSLAEYGLDKPSFRVTLWKKKDNSSQSILFGKESEKNKVYAKRDGFDTVYTVGNFVLKDLRMGVDELRDRKVTHLSQGSIDKVEVSGGGATLLLAKKGNEWEVQKPSKMDAESSEVRTLLGKITGLKAKEFVAEAAKDLGQYGLGKGAMEIVLTPKEGEKEKILVGGKFKRGSRVYLTREGSGEVLGVDSAFLADVSTNPLHYRKKQLLDFSSDDVKKVSVETRGRPPFVCKKTEDGEWKVTEPEEGEANKGAISAIVASLSHMRAREFIAENPLDLKKYGLSSPAVRARVEVEKGASLESHELLVGKEAKKKTYYAKLGDEATVFTIPSYLVKNIEKDLSAPKTGKASDK